MERIESKPKINRKATVTRYYDLQKTFDELYAQSVQKKGIHFPDAHHSI